MSYTITYCTGGSGGGIDPVIAGTFVSMCPSCGGNVIRETGGVGLPNGTVGHMERLVCERCRKEFKLMEVNDEG